MNEERIGTYPAPPRLDGNAPKKTPTGWIVSVAALAAAFAILAVAFALVVSGQGSEIGDLEDVVAERNTEIEDGQEAIAGLEADLETAETDAEALREDVDVAEDRYAAASACATRTLRAWTSTLSASYSTTGIRLGTAYYSDVCRDYRDLRGEVFEAFSS